MHRRLPLGITILAVIGAAFVVLPVLALVIRAPWGDLSMSLSGVGATTALRLSIEVSLAATALSLLFGVPLAWLLARGTFPGRSVLRAMVVLPIVLPPVVGGIGLLHALGRSGVAGQWLYEGLGIQFTFTIWGAIIAATFVSMPLVVLATEAGVHSLDQRYEMAATTLGASQGVITIVRGAVPLALFGTQGYGAVLGLIATPILLVNAFSPALFALIVDQVGWQNALDALLACSILTWLAIELMSRWYEGAREGKTAPTA